MNQDVLRKLRKLAVFQTKGQPKDVQKKAFRDLKRMFKRGDINFKND